MAKRLAPKEVVKQIWEAHGDEVAIDLSTYVNINTRCRHINKTLGEFWATPGHVIYRKQAYKSNRAIPTAEIVRRVKEVHGDTIILDISTYIDTKTKCRFIDKDYGDWWAKPNNIIGKKEGHKNRKVDKQKATFIQNYGVDNPLKCPEIKTKVKTTCLERFGSESPFENKEVQKKSKQTNLSRYGYVNAIQNKDVQEKMKQTNLIRYGTVAPLQNKDVMAKMIQTNMERYGVGSTLELKDVQEKIRQTNLERYGVVNPMQNPEIALRSAKAMNNATTLFHWLSKDEVVCVAGYEIAVVTYQNANQIDYLWHPQTFTMPDGRTYTPDQYLPDLDIWIEIKGRFQGDAEDKWNWFHKEHPNSELWTEAKLKDLGIL